MTLVQTNAAKSNPPASRVQKQSPYIIRMPSKLHGLRTSSWVPDTHNLHESKHARGIVFYYINKPQEFPESIIREDCRRDIL